MASSAAKHSGKFADVDILRYHHDFSVVLDDKFNLVAGPEL